MAHYGMLRDYRFSNDVDDIRGASLYGVDDEKLGKIDDVIFDHSSGNHSLCRRRFRRMAQQQKVSRTCRPHSSLTARHEDDFYADMTKKQIEALPRYDEDSLDKNDADENEREWSDYDERYRKSLETTGDVMHREGSTHAITPDPSELPATGDALPNEDSLRAGTSRRCFQRSHPQFE